MAWFSKQKKMKTKESTPAAPPPPAAKGEGIWYKCDACEGVVARAEYAKGWNVCPSCGQHDVLPIRRRLQLVLDPGSFQELADHSGHLTPRTLAGELAKVERNGFPVLLYHLKPAHAAELRRELAKLALPDVRVLERGEELTF